MSIENLRAALAARIADTAAAAYRRRAAAAAVSDLEWAMGWDCCAVLPTAVASARDALAAAWAAEHEAEAAENAARAAVWEEEAALRPPKTQEDLEADWLRLMVTQARAEDARLGDPRRLRGARILPHGV